MAPLLALDAEMLDPPNLRMSTLLRSGMSLALAKMEEEKKEFQDSVQKTLRDSPNRSARAYTPFNFTNCNFLFQTLLDGWEGAAVRMQIGSIEIIKSYAEQVHKKILRQQARCAVYLVKRYLGYLRLGAANIKAFKAKVARA